MFFFLQLPKLPLPALQRLDISDNRLTDIHPSSAEKTQQLRHLDISRNSFARLPAGCWPYLPYLKTLDVAWNPTRVLTKESFHGLDRLQTLVVQHLPDLKRFDADSLAQLKVIDLPSQKLILYFIHMNLAHLVADQVYCLVIMAGM